MSVKKSGSRQLHRGDHDAHSAVYKRPSGKYNGYHAYGGFLRRILRTAYVRGNASRRISRFFLLRAGQTFSRNQRPIRTDIRKPLRMFQSALCRSARRFPAGRIAVRTFREHEILRTASTGAAFHVLRPFTLKTIYLCLSNSKNTYTLWNKNIARAAECRCQPKRILGPKNPGTPVTITVHIATRTENSLPIALWMK